MTFEQIRSGAYESLEWMAEGYPVTCTGDFIHELAERDERSRPVLELAKAGKRKEALALIEAIYPGTDWSDWHGLVHY